MRRIYIILLIYFISFSSCNIGTSVNYELERLVGYEMKIPTDIVGFNLPDSVSMATYLNSKYKIIYYIDSMECTECYIESLFKWKNFYNEINQKESPIIMLFDSNDIFDIQMFMDKFELNFPFFLDQ